MATVQLLGRGYYSNPVPMGRGISRLWMYLTRPPSQNSILIYKSGEVVEGIGFENDQIKADDVYLFILGGSRFRCETGSFEYDALTAAGYSWQTITDYDSYGDDYDSQYA